MPEPILTFQSLYDLYAAVGAPVTKLDPDFGFTISQVSEMQMPLPYRSPGFRTGYFSFLFVKNGRGSYTTDDRTFPFGAGTVYFTNPGHFKSFEWLEPSDACIVTFTEAFLKENVHADIFTEFPFLLAETVRPKILDPDTFEAFEKLTNQIEEEYDGTSVLRKRIIANLLVVLLLKIKEHFWLDYDPIDEGRRSSQIVKTFRENLEMHFRELSEGKTDRTLRPQDYADMQNLNVTYLGSVIRNKTGKTISAWITEKTIAEAKTLLRNTSLSSKEIAFALGFAEAAHFSNYFKKNAAHTPASYRRMHQPG
ncbi:AraC family transcriptional regulator [Dyadobacter sandarakinus]|uniref:Helix-turn-helix transcriptional regulator n=1 Tax=Dyadobacter sandarakinus TaxID=2747268 RepID=A0ABX7I3T7_9BACT|nr:helix-turn-helix transcriptional regulator [Dyadobacter sandarakinus]QRR00540.1 helix-turn-helix transcriptional regulator [Dyadobacter sandarakinus]